MTASPAPWQPGDPVPEPTRDPDRARADLRAFGYCVIPDALDAAQVAEARERLEEQAAAEVEAGIAYEDQGPGQDWATLRGQPPEDFFTAARGGVNQRVWMLVNKGRIFRDLATLPAMLPLVEFLLGPDFLLSVLSANIAKPGGLEMGLHTDQWWLPRPLPRGEEPAAPGAMRRGEYYGPDDGDEARAINPPVACNVMYCLSDFTGRNGGTRLVPRSHLTGLQPPPGVPHDVPSVAAEGPAGTAILFEGRLWHGTGANLSNEPRLGVLATYCGPQFRAQENYTLGLAPEVRREAPPELLELLGFRVWNVYGRTGHPYEKFVDPDAEPVGEMRPGTGR